MRVPIGGPRTILVLDHEPAVLRLLRFLLVTSGYNVLEARTDEEALATVEDAQVPIDMLLAELELPRTTRRVLAQQVRARTPATRILYMSSLSDAELRRAGLAGVAVITKPLAAGTLVRRIRESFEDAWH
ncbi:MAG TPA: response regulator [Vicinamibacteria bacterium]|nr:response regulator [Vicinamibacteria bacterium]